MEKNKKIDFYQFIVKIRYKIFNTHFFGYKFLKINTLILLSNLNSCNIFFIIPFKIPISQTRIIFIINSLIKTIILPLSSQVQKRPNSFNIKIKKTFLLYILFFYYISL